MANNSPCKGCTERTPTCHGSCERYSKFRRELDEIKAIKNAENDYRGYIEDAVIKSRKRTHRKKKGWSSKN